MSALRPIRTRTQLMAELGSIRAADLEPNYPDNTPVIMEAVGSHETTRLLSTAGLLLNEYEKIKPWVLATGADLIHAGQFIAMPR